MRQPAEHAALVGRLGNPVSAARLLYRDATEAEWKMAAVEPLHPLALVSRAWVLNYRVENEAKDAARSLRADPAVLSVEEEDADYSYSVIPNDLKIPAQSN